jgi:protein disulfide-isomerase
VTKLFQVAMKFALVSSLVGLVACKRTDAEHHAEPQAVQWRQGDVATALMESARAGKPVLVYWGAAWCAPCNKLQATLFKDAAFVSLTRRLIPVHLDGDDVGAQSWGEKLHVSGYPTLLLLRADGTELARPNPFGTASAIVAALDDARSSASSSSTLVARALASPDTLSLRDWRTLSKVDWQSKGFGGKQEDLEDIRRLARTTPDPVLRLRLALLAYAPLALPEDQTRFDPVALSIDQVRDVQSLLRPTLSGPAMNLTNNVMLGFLEARLVAALPASSVKRALSDQLLMASARFRSDDRLPLTDRIDSLEIDLAILRDNRSRVPKPVLQLARNYTDAALARATDPMLRQSILHEAALVRRDAGDVEGLHRMLLRNLPRMANRVDIFERLSENAEMRQQPAEAVSWLRKQYLVEPGSASRLRFAIGYSNTAMRLTPDDFRTVAISTEAVAEALRGSKDQTTATAGQVKAWERNVVKWSEMHGNPKFITLLSNRLRSVCVRSSTLQTTCGGGLATRGNAA